MNTALKSLENNALSAVTSRAPQGIVNAIKTASAKTGVSFSYLMEKAATESNFNPTAKAKSSSATGLFQFIESTWMNMISKHGAQYGINTNQSKQSLLNLRKDPEIAACMAAEFSKENKDYLEQTVGGDIGNTELYLAHFMGAGGASAFLSQLKKNPNATAVNIFPKEANANRGVFYDSKSGAPRSLGQIYEFFDKKFSDDQTAAIMADKSPARAGGVGYQHIPFSLKKPVEYINISNNPSMNSLYRLENQLDAFFKQPINTGFGGIPNSAYGNLDAQTSMLLNILR